MLCPMEKSSRGIVSTTHRSMRDPRKTVSPSWCGEEPEMRSRGEQGVAKSSSAHTTAFCQGTLGSPIILNLNLVLEGGGRSRCWGAWGQSLPGLGCTGWGKDGWYVSLIGTLSPELMGIRDVLFLTCMSVIIRNKNSPVFLDLPPSYSPLYPTLPFLSFKIFIQFLVRVFPAKPTGLWLYLALLICLFSHRAVSLAPVLCICSLHSITVFSVWILLSKLDITAEPITCSTQRSCEYWWVTPHYPCVDLCLGLIHFTFLHYLQLLVVQRV